VAGTVSVVGLVIADVLALGLAAQVAVAGREWLRGAMPLPDTFWGVAAAWFAMRYFWNLYPGFGVAPPEELRRSMITTFMALVCHAAVLFAVKETTASRLVSVGSWFLLAPFSLVLRELTKALLIRVGLFGSPVIVLGAGRTGSLVVRDLRTNPTLGFVPVAFFDDDPVKHGTTIEGVPVLGELEQAERSIWPYPIGCAILAIPSAAGQPLAHLAQRLVRRYHNVGIIADLCGLGNMWVRPQSLGTCLTFAVRHERFENRNLLLKRAFDLAIGVPLLALAAPVIAVSVLLVKLCSRGSAFYYQSREGQNGRYIRVWKIRTMVADAEARLEAYLQMNVAARTHWERHMKLERDPRIVPWVGNFLRRSSLDELPQLWNVVKGEMSLVGPRPFPDYHLKQFDGDFRALRCQVPPGISGFWQVTGRSEGDLETQRVADSYYIQNWSLWLDVWILSKTIEAVVKGNGAY
jgi:Undecaprenyl-phosphate galactose phosphotransferase WbaP